MENDKVYCETCKKEVAYHVQDAKHESSTKHGVFTYNGVSAYCVHCGNEVYVPDVDYVNFKVWRNKIAELKESEKFMDVRDFFRLASKYCDAHIGEGACIGCPLSDYCMHTFDLLTPEPLEPAITALREWDANHE